MKKTLLPVLLFAINIINISAQENPSTDGQCWTTIASGGFHNLAIREDGTLWGWGKNYSNSFSTLPEDVQLPLQIGTDSDWISISCGNSHNLALKADGTLWAWGRNDAGQVGTGVFTIYPTEVPTQIGTDTNWAMISAGGGLGSAAIKTDGTLWTWGFVNTGESLEIQEQGGDPTTLFITTPAQMGTDTNWKQVDVGHNHTVAVKTDGTLWAWGLNYHGQLGLGTNENIYVPAQAGTDTDWDMAMASNVMTAALKTDRSLWTWGENTGGSLGNGIITSYQSNIPVQISSAKWRTLELGMNYFCGAIKTDGSLWTWGSSISGAVGNGTTGYVGSLYMVPSETEWLQYSGGGDYSVALKADGTLLTWGYNWYHQLGFNIDEGNTITSPLPVYNTCATTAGTVTNNANTFSIYPNPAINELHLAITSGKDIQSITITDALGKTILLHKGYTNGLDIAKLPAGVYFIKAETPSGNLVQKFIKQ